MVYGLTLISVISIVGVVSMWKNKDEELMGKEELLSLLSRHIHEFSNSEKLEVRQLAQTLNTIRNNIQDNKVDHLICVDFLSEFDTVKNYSSSLHHFSKRDKKVVKQNLKNVAEQLNQKIQALPKKTNKKGELQ